MTTESTTLVINDEHDYALMYRDAASASGDALIERDHQLASEPRWLPPNRWHVVNLATGTIVEWRSAELVDRACS